VDGKIGTRDTDGDIILIDVDQYVRPMLDGFIFKTPDEIITEDKLSMHRDCVFSDIDNRVVEFIKSKSGMLDPAVSYSAYRSDQNDIPIDNLDEIAICGKCIIVEDIYQSPVVENPTWLDLCLLAEYMIRETEDYHHIFLEGVCKSDQEIDGVPVYKFCMGS
jgi:hypothetical protein